MTEEQFKMIERELRALRDRLQFLEQSFFGACIAIAVAALTGFL